MPTLRPKRCAIPSHRGRTDCCGRSERVERGRPSAPKWKYIGPGIRQYPDGHIERTPAALKRFKDSRLEKGDPCYACHEPFDDYRDVETSHVESKGFNGWKRDDSDPNLVLMHKGANRAQGSMPLDVYLKEFWKPEHCR